MFTRKVSYRIWSNLSLAICQKPWLSSFQDVPRKVTMFHNIQNLNGELIDLTNFPSLFNEENIILHKMFKKYNHEVRIAGGAVRDILLGISPHDIDYATDATPTEMIEMFTREEIRMLNRNGEAHGTVTVRINDKANFEITTLRIDVEPDGRHSKVVFTDDWRLDAARRDLTVNSMFLSLDLDSLSGEKGVEEEVANTAPASAEAGECSSGCGPPDQKKTGAHRRPVTGRIHDFFCGRTDLEARRVRFVGDPVARIREDYLRILRYFRFHGRLVRATEGDGHDPETLKAIASNADGLSRIAGERCWTELQRILLCPRTPALLQDMSQVGLFPHLSLPPLTQSSRDELTALWARDILSLTPSPATCLATLLSSLDQIETVTSRLHLSNQEVSILAHIVKYREEDRLIPSDQRLKHYQKKLLLSREAPNKLRPVLTELMYYLWGGGAPALLTDWAAWVPPKFPVSGHLIQQQWSLPNRAMAGALLALRQLWVDSDCRLTADELVTEANRLAIVGQVPATPAASATSELKVKRLKRQ